MDISIFPVPFDLEARFSFFNSSAWGGLRGKFHIFFPNLPYNDTTNTQTQGNTPGHFKQLFPKYDCPVLSSQSILYHKYASSS